MTTHHHSKTDTASTGPATIVVHRVPPADAKIPMPPAGFVPTNAGEYRGVTPRKAELAVLPDVLEELNRFTDFAEVFGKTTPPIALVRQLFDAATGWSSMRAKASAWDLYCKTQEGLAWRDARALMDRMRPAFELAVTTDATVATRNPGLARLLSAAKTTAQKGAATRKANKALVQEGKAATHGKAAQRRKKDKAAAARVATVVPGTTHGVIAHAVTPSGAPWFAAAVAPIEAERAAVNGAAR